jgi:hypothetical protein
MTTLEGAAIARAGGLAQPTSRLPKASGREIDDTHRNGEADFATLSS